MAYQRNPLSPPSPPPISTIDHSQQFAQEISDMPEDLTTTRTSFIRVSESEFQGGHFSADDLVWSNQINTRFHNVLDNHVSISYYPGVYQIAIPDESSLLEVLPAQYSDVQLDPPLELARRMESVHVLETGDTEVVPVNIGSAPVTESSIHVVETGDVLEANSFLECIPITEVAHPASLSSTDVGLNSQAPSTSKSQTKKPVIVLIKVKVNEAVNPKECSWFTDFGKQLPDPDIKDQNARLHKRYANVLKKLRTELANGTWNTVAEANKHIEDYFGDKPVLKETRKGPRPDGKRIQIRYYQNNKGACSAEMLVPPTQQSNQTLTENYNVLANDIDFNLPASAVLCHPPVKKSHVKKPVKNKNKVVKPVKLEVKPDIKMDLSSQVSHMEPYNTSSSDIDLSFNQALIENSNIPTDINVINVGTSLVKKSVMKKKKTQKSVKIDKPDIMDKNLPPRLPATVHIPQTNVKLEQNDMDMREQNKSSLPLEEQTLHNCNASPSLIINDKGSPEFSAKAKKTKFSKVLLTDAGPGNCSRDGNINQILADENKKRASNSPDKMFVCPTLQANQTLTENYNVPANPVDFNLAASDVLCHLPVEKSHVKKPVKEKNIFVKPVKLEVNPDIKMDLSSQVSHMEPYNTSSSDTDLSFNQALIENSNIPTDINVINVGTSLVKKSAKKKKKTQKSVQIDKPDIMDKNLPPRLPATVHIPQTNVDLEQNDIDMREQRESSLPLEEQTLQNYYASPSLIINDKGIPEFSAKAKKKKFSKVLLTDAGPGNCSRDGNINQILSDENKKRASNSPDKMFVCPTLQSKQTLTENYNVPANPVDFNLAASDVLCHLPVGKSHVKKPVKNKNKVVKPDIKMDLSSQVSHMEPYNTSSSDIDLSFNQALIENSNIPTDINVINVGTSLVKKSAKKKKKTQKSVQIDKPDIMDKNLPPRLPATVPIPQSNVKLEQNDIDMREQNESSLPLEEQTLQNYYASPSLIINDKMKPFPETNFEQKDIDMMDGEHKKSLQDQIPEPIKKNRRASTSLIIKKGSPTLSPKVKKIKFSKELVTDTCAGNWSSGRKWFPSQAEQEELYKDLNFVVESDKVGKPPMETILYRIIETVDGIVCQKYTPFEYCGREYHKGSDKYILIGKRRDRTFFTRYQPVYFLPVIQTDKYQIVQYFNIEKITPHLLSIKKTEDLFSDHKVVCQAIFEELMIPGFIKSKILEDSPDYDEYYKSSWDAIEAEIADRAKSITAESRLAPGIITPFRTYPSVKFCRAQNKDKVKHCVGCSPRQRLAQFRVEFLQKPYDPYTFEDLEGENNPPLDFFLCYSCHPYFKTLYKLLQHKWRLYACIRTYVTDLVCELADDEVLDRQESVLSLVGDYEWSTKTFVEFQVILAEADKDIERLKRESSRQTIVHGAGA